MNNPRPADIGIRQLSVILTTLLGCMLTACDQALSLSPEAGPVLVTLPALPSQPPTPTVEPTSVPPTPVPTQPVPPTPAPQSVGIGATHLLWEWNEVARPSSLAVGGSRLAVIVADGRFVWLNAQDGRLEAGAFLWSGLLEGDSWGEVYTDGMVAVVAAREMSISPQTGLADSRARLAVYDAGGNELWSLPELGAQHFYSAALAPGSVLVGKWPHGFDDNSLAAYELLTGQKLWEISDEQTGYQQIVHDGTRMYVLLNNLSGGAVVCYDLRTGEELWRWSDPTIQQPDLIVLANDSLYVQTVDRTLALDKIAGTVKWVAILQTAPEAGLAILGGLLYLAPAPAAELGFRPGVVGLRADNGELAWHSLSGLLADPLAVGGEAVWTIVKDYSSGQVWLSGLEPQTGLELIRLPIGNDPQTLYQLVASGRQVYILGNSLLAYGY